MTTFQHLSDHLFMMGKTVQAQIRGAVEAFQKGDAALARRISARDDYLDNLNTQMEEEGYRLLATMAPGSFEHHLLVGTVRVAKNLEKIGDYAENIAQQALHLVGQAGDGPQTFPSLDLQLPTEVAVLAVGEAVEAFIEQDPAGAKRVCKREVELDRLFKERLEGVLAALETPGSRPRPLVTLLFLLKYLERIGYAVLNIGETTLYLTTGQKMKLHQYLHLEHLLGPEFAGDRRIEIRSLWGGISGARIGRVCVEKGPAVVFKEGAERKIAEEVEKAEVWNRLSPGIVPRILRHHAQEGREAFLDEYLEGIPLDQIYLLGSWEEQRTVTERLLESLERIWRASLRPEHPSVTFVVQIEQRLPEVYHLHPLLRDLRGVTKRIGGQTALSVEELLARIALLQKGWAPPAAVWIHGDLNANNLFYLPDMGGVQLIDVHRSGFGDYLQDLTVFLVSLVRHPLTASAPFVDRVQWLVEDWARGFAASIGDDAFPPRLQLGLARSYLTSTRLLRDAAFARRLFLRGIRCLEKAARGGLRAEGGECPPAVTVKAGEEEVRR
jgi:phosphate uptake regulator/aminoglycoside phosphotransferase